MSLLSSRFGAAAILSTLAVAGLGHFRGAQARHTDAAAAVALASSELGCEHTDGSDWECPDTTFRFMSATNEIGSARMGVTSTSGRTKTLQLRRGTDAVFLTRSAIERFLLAHFARTDRRKAEQLRARLRPTSVCVHVEPSEWECYADTAQFMFVPRKTASASVTATSTAGRTFTLPLAWGTDAVFLTRPAVETFLVDYYNRTNRAKARQLRAHIQRHWPTP